MKGSPQEETTLASTPAPAGARTPSLPESHRSVRVAPGAGFFRKLLAYTGPGYLVAVGYMDPGNWATDLEGGSRFGYRLLSVIVISNLIAILLQHLCARLGIASGRDLAQACRDTCPRSVNLILWSLCEIAICACDLAEVIGSATAITLLFPRVPLVLGVAITGLDVLVLLALQNKGFRYLEALVISLIVVIGACFALEMAFSRPSIGGILEGVLPRLEIVRNPEMLFIAVGILGATVMPHNLYLHSSIVQTRKYDQSDAGKHEAIKFATIDSTIALTLALFINAAILILAAAAFHGTANAGVSQLGQAYELLAPALGVGAASTLFAVALLASGQNSTITGTLAGQIVMEGFLNLRIRPWLRRMITRLIAIVPAMVVAALYGADGTMKLLILSQVILSLQLPFAVIPLLWFVGRRRMMGAFAPPRWLMVFAWSAAAVIVALNAQMLWGMSGELVGGGSNP